MYPSGARMNVLYMGWSLVCGLALLACSSDRSTPGPVDAGGGNTTVPGPPKVLAVYEFDLGRELSCDLLDPRSYVDGFPEHPRCVPDLLQPADAERAYSPISSLLYVFNQKLDGTRVGRAATASAGAIPVPIDYGSYYDPRGRDFRQGLPGSAPPGPSLRLFLGQQGSGLSAPAGLATTVCLDAAHILDLSGAPFEESADQPRCVTLKTQPFAPIGFSPADGASVSVRDLFDIEAFFNAAVAAETAIAGNLEIAFANGVIPLSCYSVSLGGNDGTNGVAASLDQLTPSCVPAPGQATVTVRRALTDPYGIALNDDVVWHFTVTP